MIQPEAFEALASSSNGIAKLRELILELAVRGLLVPQDPNDEPASELFKQIENEKFELVQSGRIKKDKPLSQIRKEELPFEIPSSWLWMKIGSASLFTEYGTSEKSNHLESGVPVLKMGDIQNGSVLLGGQKKVPENIEDLPQLFLEKFDLLYNRTNSAELVGKTGIYLGEDNEYTFASYLIRIRCSKTSMHAMYLNFAMNASYFRRTQILPHLKQQCGQANVNGTILKNMLVPIPPINEQYRIVSKIDELLALCDQLERRQNHSNIVHQQLLQTLLESLTQAVDNEAFQKIWSQIAAHFDTLFITEASIDQLKQVILQLAVMGKLVSQDPNDEPASVLLEKINAEKQRLVNEGKIKKQPSLPEISNEEKPFDLPITWTWVRLGDVTNYGFTEKAEPNEVDDQTWVLELEDIEKVSSRLLGKICYAERQFKSSKNHFYSGDVLYGKLRPYLDKVLVADENGVCTTEIIPVRGYMGLSPKFLRLVMKSPYFTSYANESTHGMNLPRLGTDKARLALIPLVSEPEQSRIIAKVDELMAICDLLKNRISKSQQTQEHLATAIVEKTAA